MPKEHIPDEKVLKRRKPEERVHHKEQPGEARAPLSGLQQTVGNRAVQRLLAQRSMDGASKVDDDTAARINQKRGSGQALDSTVQARMSTATGQDFSGVKVHTDPESHALNEQLSAKAFTTGQDIFFRDGAYDPGSSAGQELLAHELTHVVQQSSGRVGGGDKMTVNDPGDAFETEADTVAKSVMSPGAGADVQRQEEPEEEELAQAKRDDVQRQEIPEEEELAQAKRDDVQRQEIPEEEELAQAKRIDVQMQEIPEEEEVQMQEMPEEEELMMKRNK
jgi:hypothetical protein